MRPFHRVKWLGLYALIPLSVVLLVLEHNAALSPREHAVVLITVVVVIAVLANRWMAHHAALMDRTDVDTHLTWLPPTYQFIRGDLEWKTPTPMPVDMRVPTEDQALYAEPLITRMEKRSL